MRSLEADVGNMLVSSTRFDISCMDLLVGNFVVWRRFPRFGVTPLRGTVYSSFYKFQGWCEFSSGDSRFYKMYNSPENRIFADSVNIIVASIIRTRSNLPALDLIGKFSPPQHQENLPLSAVLHPCHSW